MISVPIDRIVPLTDARDNFSRLVADVENMTDGLYVLTKGGKPAIALISIKYLEEIMGDSQNGQSSHKTDQLTPPRSTPPRQSPIISAPTLQSSPPSAPRLNFAVPKITPPSVKPPAPSAPAPNQNPPFASALKPVGGGQQTGVSSPSNYDVKPEINPTWRGEEPKSEQPSSSSAPAHTQNPIPTATAPTLKPEVSPPVISPPISARAPVNPWPIIAPRPTVSSDTSEATVAPRPTVSSDTSEATVAPRPTVSRDTSEATVPPRPTPSNEPLAPSAPAPSQSQPLTTASKPAISESQLDTSSPRMVAPPPPPPPSSLPRIPSNFQAVPIPINGNRQSPAYTAPAPSQSPIQSAPPPKTEDSRQSPVTPSLGELPPPPITNAPAPFSTSTSSVTPPMAGLAVNPSSLAVGQPPVLNSPASAVMPRPTVSKEASETSITFDQPPTTVLEPGEDLPHAPEAKIPTPISNSPEIVPPTATPPQSQASVQDLEI